MTDTHTATAYCPAGIYRTDTQYRAWYDAMDRRERTLLTADGLVMGAAIAETRTPVTILDYAGTPAAGVAPLTHIAVTRTWRIRPASEFTRERARLTKNQPYTGWREIGRVEAPDEAPLVVGYTNGLVTLSDDDALSDGWSLDTAERTSLVALLTVAGQQADADARKERPV